MKRETEERIKAKAIRAWEGFKGLVPLLTVSLGGGMIVGGYVGAVENSRRIKKLESKHDKLRADYERTEAWLNQEVVPKHNNLADYAHREIESLKEENRTLMKKALQETEGK